MTRLYRRMEDRWVVLDEEFGYYLHDKLGWSLHDSYVDITTLLEADATNIPTAFFAPNARSMIQEALDYRYECLRTARSEGRFNGRTLTWLLSPERKVAIHTHDAEWGAIIDYIGVHHIFSGRRYITIKYSVYVSDGESFYQDKRELFLPYFHKLLTFDDLPLHPCTQNEYDGLRARAQKYLPYCIGHHHLRARGNIIKRGFWHSENQSAPIDERVVIDNQIAQHKLDYKGRWSYNKDDARDTLTPDEEFALYPFVYGYGLRMKKWGKFYVEHLSAPEFEEDVFERVVMPVERKRIITALTTGDRNRMRDIVRGKGQGLIMLLYGPPGTGKTLTAETVAEVQHRPLLRMTSGDLGAAVASLEDNLEEILTLAQRWNAVLLIDEADVFMAERDGDIQRNALVSVFLRLLEYYSGLMFLTTNRVSTFGRAALSRVTVALPYGEEDTPHKRRSIWENLCEVNGVSLSEDALERLSSIELNGRQISSVLKMALIMSAEPTLTDILPVCQLAADVPTA